MLQYLILAMILAAVADFRVISPNEFLVMRNPSIDRILLWTLLLSVVFLFCRLYVWYLARIIQDLFWGRLLMRTGVAPSVELTKPADMLIHSCR